MDVGGLVSDICPYVQVTDTLSNTLKLMLEHQISCMLVCENATPAGVVSEHDITKLLSHAISGRSCQDTSVCEIMSACPPCVKPTTPLKDALTLCCQHRLHYFPVVDDNKSIVGVVRQHDILNAHVKLLERHAELEEKNIELEMLSFEDVLLGMGNRRAMEVDLGFVSAAAKRFQRSYAVALMDVDYFKQYNDQYGHQAGDCALKLIADTIKDAARDSDRLYRYGGEEILLLMPDTDLDGARKGAERIRKSIVNLKHPHIGSAFGFLTVSIGIACEVSGDWINLLNHADRALYEAKQHGRNQVRNRKILLQNTA